MDPISGFKIMRFLESLKEFSFDDPTDVDAGVDVLRKLQDADIQSPYTFDYIEQMEITLRSMNAMGKKRAKGFDWLFDRMKVLDSYLKADKWKTCLRHGDARAANFIINNGQYYLIDWEYAGNSDIGYDIAHYCSEIGRAEENGVWKLTRENIARFYQHPVTDEEYRHIIGCFALDEFYWFFWTINLVSQGHDVEDCFLRCFKNSSEYGKEALKLYGEKSD